MKIHLISVLLALVCVTAAAGEKSSQADDVVLWYDAFNNKNPALLDQILSDEWIDIPSVPGQTAGARGAKPLLSKLTAIFPDFHVTILEILQDGNKVIVRSEITGTQREKFMGFSSKGRKMTIQAVDIHEFKDGKIVRTWHTEDWMTGLRQLGVIDK
jgi:steroid delta-isomerase-like uncharacterized protein